MTSPLAARSTTFTRDDIGDDVVTISLDSISKTVFVDMHSGLVLIGDDLTFGEDMYEDDIATSWTVAVDWTLLPGLVDTPLKGVRDAVSDYAYEALKV